MRIHFVLPSGGVSRFGLIDPLRTASGVLVSYAYGDRDVDDARVTYPEQHLILDCGAFSAFNSGATIDLKTYGRKAAEMIERGATAVALDVIGDAQRSWANFKALKRMGVNVRPVLTAGTPRDQVKRAIEADGGPDAYLFLGGLGLPGAKHWLDRTYAFLMDYGLVRTHLFGRSGLRDLSRYPAYTCDAMSWLSPILWGNHPAQTPKRAAKFSMKNETATIMTTRCRDMLFNGLELERQMTDLWKRRGVTWPS